MFKQVLSKISKWDLAEKLIFVFLCISQSYYIYRYIFRFGSEISSPGYSPTPQFLQIAKYIIVLIFLLIFLIFILKNKIFKKKLIFIFKNKAVLISGALFTYLFLSVFKYINYINFGFTQTIKMIFIIPFVFIIPIIINSKNRESILKYSFVFALFFHFIFNLIVILLFAIFEIMPGMDFGNYVGRFGGAWDDPNAFSALLVLIFAALVIFLDKKRDTLPYLLTSLLTFYLIFTYSISGLMGFILTGLLLLIMKRINIKMIITILLTAVLASGFLYFSDFYKPIYNDKSGSINQHLESVDYSGKQVENTDKESNLFFGFFNRPSFNENFYIQYNSNFGLFGSLLLIIFILSIYKDMVLYYLNINNKDDFNKKFILLFLIYVPSFVVMNMGIPFFQVFPINLIFWVGLGFVFSILYVNEFNRVVKD